MNKDELPSTAYGRGLGLEACTVYSQAELDAAVAAERERCAEICETLAEGARDNAAPGAPYWDEAAAAIREQESL